MILGDDAYLYAAARSPLIAERRFDRAYDESSPATIFHPNGTKLSSFDRAFCGAATREVIELTVRGIHLPAPRP